MKAFQTDNDLEATGQVDQNTAEVLQSELMEHIRNGEDDLQLEKALEIITK